MQKKNNNNNNNNIYIYIYINIQKIVFKVVQMMSLAMHITNQKVSFYIFTVGISLKYLHGTSSLLNM